MNTPSPTPEEVRVLAERLVETLCVELGRISSEITGHVVEVHANSWYAVYILGPIGMSDEEFHRAVKKTRSVITRIWPEKLCIPRHPAGVGHDLEGKPFCAHWLPVPPNRTAADFKGFYPKPKVKKFRFKAPA